ncbi:hypothetical protein ABMX62_23060 [Vibrio vulnificus]|uniref:hypothetical protein n=1 Tax=Vibrio vulnificus TaxID=672 RepID=UPI0040597BE3
MAKDTFENADCSTDKTSLSQIQFSNKETALPNTTSEKAAVNAFSSAKAGIKVPPERSWLGDD